MSKKVLGALLAIVMVLSVLSVTAFAAGATSYEEDATLYTQTWALTEPVAVTGGYQVNVVLTTNYKVGPISFKIDGASSVTNVTVGSGYYAGSYVSFGAEGLVLITPNTSATVGSKEVTNAVVATVTYTSGTPTIANNPKTAANPSGTLIAARCDSDSVNASNFILGQKATVLGAGEAPVVVVADLALKAGVTGVVIDKNKTIGGTYAGVVYGFAQAANNTFKSSAYITNALEATNGGSLEITTSDGKAGNYGTGTTIKVLNADGTTAKTYGVCIFGDVDGNGLINTADANAVKASVNNTKIPNNSIQRLAANAQNVNNATMMHNIVTGDASAIKGHIGSAKIDMAALAAKHNSFNNNYQ